MNKPIILKESSFDRRQLAKFKKEHKIWQFKDIYKSQLAELFQISNAFLLGKEKESEKTLEFIDNKLKTDYELKGNYVYFPWSGLLLHMVNENDLTALRTNRTRNLVDEKEQALLGRFTAGVVGLSFGNGIALSLVYSGMANSIKIADKDIFETTNLNRVRVGLQSVAEQKTEITAREIYEINPYAKIDVFKNGLTKNNIDEFFFGNPKLKIVFDVVDDFSMKVRIRLKARKAKIPVVMLTSLEDSVLVDVERFDINPKAEIFHGLLGKVTKELLDKKMTEKEKAKYAISIVNPKHVSYRNLLSLSEIGKKLVSRPHLYGTVSVVCGIAAYIVKRIVLKDDMPSIRSFLPFNKILGIAPNREDTPEARNKVLKYLLK